MRKLGAIFFTGLLTVLPIVVTIYFTVWVLRVLEQFFGKQVLFLIPDDWYRTGMGLLVAIIINIFLQSPAMTMAISAIGVLLFAGLTAYDTQKIKSMYAYVAGTDMMGKVVIMGALNLYLDFINMFQFLLSFMGSRE